jgi:ATP-dependent helicase/nuclease subunit A
MSAQHETRSEVAEALTAQTRAADPARSVWVAASAGTGKTKVLVDRISRLLLAGTAPSRILCLTFTKAAAAEMVNRLSERLGGWAMAADDDLRADLARLLGGEPDAADTARARTLFAAALDAPGGMHIRTIHSFCEALLGRFPLEARVAPHFTVADARLADDILRAARNALFDAAVGDPADIDGGGPHDPVLRNAFRHAARRMDEAGFDALMGAMMAERGKLEALLERDGGPDGVMARVRAALGVSPGDTSEGLAAAAAASVTDADLHRLAEAWSHGAKSDADAKAPALRAWLTLDAPRRAARWDEAAALVLKKDRRPVADRTLMSKAAQEHDPGAFDIAARLRDAADEAAERLRALACAEATETLVRIAAALLRGYEARKTAMAALDFGDLILKAAALLESDGGAGWVHYKLDGGLEHVLIDESQDTAPEQWRIVRALVREFFSGEGAYQPRAEDSPRTLFVVGDVKQSIYSFQGADPDRYAAVRREIGEQAGGALTGLGMTVSFRSTPSVLNAVDGVFAADDARDGVAEGAEPIEHLAHRNGQAGRVELWPTADPLDREPASPWDAPLDQETEASPSARLADVIARRIAAWIGTEPLESRGRTVQPGDVMILVRKRGALAAALVRALKDHGVPVAGSDRMVLTEQIAVQDLMALGDALLLPDDDLTLAAVLKGPLFDIDDTALFDLAYGRSGRLWTALLDTDDARFAAARDTLKALRGRVDFETPYQTFAHVLNTGGRRRWLERLGPDAADAVDAFLTRALDFEHDHAPTMQGFLHWMRTGATELKRDLEQTTGAVRVMTVHGSKGLQAPVVILPDTCSVPDGKGESRILWGAAEGDPPLLWRPARPDEPAAAAALREAREDRRMREYRRLLYVAMTRAADRLIVCGYTGKRPVGAHPDSWYALVQRAFADGGPLQAHAREAVMIDGLGEGVAIWNPQAKDAEPRAGDAADEAPAAAPDWLHRPPAPEPVPHRPLSPTKPADADAAVAPPFAEDAGARFKRGTLIHRLLQALPDVPPDRRDAVARRWLARPAHGLDDAEQDAVAAETLAVLADPAFAAVFGPGSRAEVPVVGVVDGPDGPETVSARIDRLIVTDDAVLVVDFKTNRPPPETESAVDAAYIRQLALYRALMQKAFPGKRVDCALVWTLNARLMPISAARLDAWTAPPPA